MSEENVELVRGLLTAIQEKRPDDVLPHLHSAFEIVPSPTFPETAILRGPTGFMRFMSRWPEMFSDYEFTHDRFWDAGEQVVVALHERARTARGGGITLDDRFAHVWTLQDGLVSKIQIFDDQAEALDAVGLNE
jgi:ketosteroid isomerase-like protein